MAAQAIRGCQQHSRRFIFTTPVRHFEPLTVLAVASGKALAAKVAASGAVAAKGAAVKATAAKATVAATKLAPSASGTSACGAPHVAAIKPGIAAAAGGVAVSLGGVADLASKEMADAAWEGVSGSLAAASTAVVNGAADATLAATDAITNVGLMDCAADATSTVIDGVTDATSIVSDAVDGLTTALSDGLTGADNEASTSVVEAVTDDRSLIDLDCAATGAEADGLKDVCKVGSGAFTDGNEFAVSMTPHASEPAFTSALGAPYDSHDSASTNIVDSDLDTTRGVRHASSMVADVHSFSDTASAASAPAMDSGVGSADLASNGHEVAGGSDSTGVAGAPDKICSDIVDGHTAVMEQSSDASDTILATGTVACGVASKYSVATLSSSLNAGALALGAALKSVAIGARAVCGTVRLLLGMLGFLVTSIAYLVSYPLCFFQDGLSTPFASGRSPTVPSDDKIADV